ncbi:geranylgeranyl pyrophosphate synthase [Penicillium atrosanguineum]|uniref:geranylgeranyl pyrophosphate synthase n=1 Tax=Penicillium atrosanguineum TaxID=1132637 RepID=UPI0023830019|nr:geranylgeranyl pyrophosphate synthase [Penicillium atrosanguineum]KAJ5313469.1 geranylgeranyl pyrophosphate synthase [Penicillium atrosanguineum]
MSSWATAQHPKSKNTMAPTLLPSVPISVDRQADQYTEFYACRAGSGASKGPVKVYASWKGAIEVRTWEVYLGDDEQDLRKVTTGARNGFETEIRVSGAGSYVMVKAGSAQTEVARVQSC